jgi:photosystem II stability/assembly factor-like uncharacterized protein
MKTFKIFLFAISLLSFNFIQAQWTDLNAPSSNYETYQSLAVSDDGKNLFSYMSDLSGNPFLVSSHDYGSTWQKYPQPKVNYNVPTAPVAAVTTFWEGDVLYYVSADMAFRKSTDFGATTIKLNSTARSLSFPILRMPNGNWYVGDAGYNWVSTDKGANWTQSTGGIYGIAYITTNNGNIVALQNNTVIGYSSDGLTWNKSGMPAGIMGGGNTPRLSKAADGTILAYFYSTPTSFILKSTDNGVSFQLVNATIPANTNIMYFYGNDMIAVDILGNTYKSSDNGLNFSKINSLKLLTTVSGMITNRKNIYLYGMSTIYRYGNSPTGIHDMQPQSNLIITQNPCKDKLQFVSNDNLKDFTIYDLAGEIVLKNRISGEYIDVSCLHSGVFLISVTDNLGQYKIAKFMKE